MWCVMTQRQTEGKGKRKQEDEEDEEKNPGFFQMEIRNNPTFSVDIIDIRFGISIYHIFR